MGMILMGGFWHVALLFGGWMAFFPPRTRVAKLAFCLVAIVAGLWATHVFESLRPWDTEDTDYNIVSPSPQTALLYSSLLACVTTIVCVNTCSLAVQHWLAGPPPDHTLRRTGIGGQAFRDLHG